MSLPSQIEQIQPDVVFKLLSEPLFDGIAIFAIREKRLDSQVNKSLAGLGGSRGDGGTVLGGLTIEVLMPTVSNPEPDSPGPIAVARQVFLIKEQPTVNLGANGVGVTAEQCAQNIIQTFHLFSQGSATTQDGLQCWYAGNPCMDYEDAGPGSPFLMVKVTLFAKLAFTPLPAVATPTFSYADGNVTLTDGEPGGGSAIYYTTDGSFPGPGNAATNDPAGAALVYTAPFEASPGAIIRAASYNADAGQGSAAITAIVS